MISGTILSFDLMFLFLVQKKLIASLIKKANSKVDFLTVNFGDP